MQTITAAYFCAQKKRYCRVHKLPGHVNLQHSLCEHCEVPASFGYMSDKKRRFCGKHKEPGTVSAVLFFKEESTVSETATETDSETVDETATV
jgi:EsV-1-7 cysteine-rich motif